ncbi:uncharacterized protein [Mytilus edulis]|uniref:uncharacterized protein n=1 Tax=Mytilus edulis TaxID=6550 RepID=UPI0039F1152B
MFNFFILVLLPIITFGCCPPKIWTSTNFVNYASGQTHLEILQDNYMDNGMSVISQNLTTDQGMTFNQKLYSNFTSGMQYVVDKDGSCMGLNITNTGIGEGCLPDDAVFAKSYIGVGANKIPVTMYNIKTNVYNTYFTVIDDGCLPYLYESTGTLPNGEGVKTTVEYFGVMVVKSDPKMTMLPASCMM